MSGRGGLAPGPVSPTTFRRDPWLRSSGYHLATWSLLGLVLELRRLSPGEGAAVGGAGLLFLVAAAVLTSFTHERRIGKMAGPAGEAVWPGAAALWRTLLAALAAASALLLTTENAGMLFPLWCAGVGCGFWLWGRGAGFPWYEGLGLLMSVAALVDVGLLWAEGSAAPGFRFAVLGLVLPGAGLLTSRRFLWFRPPADG
ncbi:MAG: hypothetical protein ABR538_16810 [Candidatus Binatia bacterium]